MSIHPFYGVRVLAVELDRRRVTFRVFVIDYTPDRRWHAELPADPGFFLQLLWESADDHNGALRHVADWREMDDDGWLAVNTRWFVAGVDRVAVRNEQLSDEDWEHIGALPAGADEGRLVQGDYEVRATDPRWLEHLRPGLSWETGYYPDPTHQVRAEDAPYVPDLTAPEAVITPFADSDSSVVVLAFSDDGRFLAVTNEDGELAVHDMRDRSVPLHAEPESAGRDIMWVPGRHLVTLKEDEYDDLLPWAYDLDTDTEIDIPVEPGRARSRTGRFRVAYGSGGRVDFVSARSGESAPDRTIRLGDASRLVTSVAFSADETRMFVGHGLQVHVIEPATGRILNTLTMPGDWLDAVAASPDGAYLAAATQDWNDERTCTPDIFRVADGQLVMRRPRKDHTQPGIGAHALAWSPDGARLAVIVENEIHFFRVGLPTEPATGLGLALTQFDAALSPPSGGRPG